LWRATASAVTWTGMSCRQFLERRKDRELSYPKKQNNTKFWRISCDLYTDMSVLFARTLRYLQFHTGGVLLPQRRWGTSQVSPSSSISRKMKSSQKAIFSTVLVTWIWSLLRFEEKFLMKESANGDCWNLHANAEFWSSLLWTSIGRC
jgi:hypothetical protein